MEKRRDLKPASFRLSEEAREILRKLSARNGVSMTSVLEAVLRDEARRAGIRRSTEGDRYTLLRGIRNHPGYTEWVTTIVDNETGEQSQEFIGDDAGFEAELLADKLNDAESVRTETRASLNFALPTEATE